MSFLEQIKMRPWVGVIKTSSACFPTIPTTLIDEITLSVVSLCYQPSRDHRDLQNLFLCLTGRSTLDSESQHLSRVIELVAAEPVPESHLIPSPG